MWLLTLSLLKTFSPVYIPSLLGVLSILHRHSQSRGCLLLNSSLPVFLSLSSSTFSFPSTHSLPPLPPSLPPSLPSLPPPSPSSLPHSPSSLPPSSLPHSPSLQVIPTECSKQRGQRQLDLSSQERHPTQPSTSQEGDENAGADTEDQATSTESH